jgi:hypothetical protein
MGSGSNDAQKAQERQEKERQAAIRQGTAAVNQAYDNPQREKDIGDFLAANRQLYFDELNKQNVDNTRQLKFALARNGQLGGSVQVDAGRRAGEAYQQGVLTAEREAASAANNLRAADEDNRRSLLAMVQSGLDATTAGARASAGLRTSLEGARAGMKVDALGDVFGSFSDLYKRSRESAAERRARSDAQALYNTGPIYGTVGARA